MLKTSSFYNQNWRDPY